MENERNIFLNYEGFYRWASECEGLENTIGSNLFFFIQSTHVFSVFFGATVHVFPNFEYIVIHLKRQGQGEECLVMPELMALLLFQMMRNSFYSPKPCWSDPWPPLWPLVYQSAPHSTSASILESLCPLQATLATAWDLCTFWNALCPDLCTLALSPPSISA